MGRPRHLKGSTIPDNWSRAEVPGDVVFQLQERLVGCHSDVRRRLALVAGAIGSLNKDFSSHPETPAAIEDILTFAKSNVTSTIKPDKAEEKKS